MKKILMSLLLLFVSIAVITSCKGKEENSDKKETADKEENSDKEETPSKEENSDKEETASKEENSDKKENSSSGDLVEDVKKMANMMCELNSLMNDGIEKNAKKIEQIGKDMQSFGEDMQSKYTPEQNAKNALKAQTAMKDALKECDMSMEDVAKLMVKIQEAAKKAGAE